MTQNAISTYGDMWIMKAALEKAGKADREAVAEALRTLDGGPSPYFPGGELKFDEKGRRVDAGLTIIQWQYGVPVTVFPPELAVAEPIWPKAEPRRHRAREPPGRLTRGGPRPPCKETTMSKEVLERGLEIRKAVLGREFVEKSFA